MKTWYKRNDFLSIYIAFKLNINRNQKYYFGLPNDNQFGINLASTLKKGGLVECQQDLPFVERVEDIFHIKILPAN